MSIYSAQFKMFSEGPSRIRVLNSLIENECTVSQVRCLRLSKTKNILFIFLAVVTLGFTWLLAYWSSKLNRRLRYRYCELARATHFIFLNWDEVWEIVPRVDKHIVNQHGESVCMVSFENRFIAYYYDPEKEVFCTARYQLGEILDDLARNQLPLHSQHHRLELLEQFGPNLIQVPVSSRLSLFMGEVLSPFQVFQFYAIILWYCESYYIFPTVLILASLATYIYNVTLLQQTQKKLKEDSDMRSQVSVIVGDVKTKARVEKIRSEEIVPGEMFYLREGQRVPCDCIVIMGGCVVNENYITGDPHPIRKVELRDYVYKSEHQGQFTLYMGTEVMEIQGEMVNRVDVPPPDEKSILCLSTKTNYYTLRGQYLRSILYPKSHSTQFYTESIQFLLIIAGITLLAWVIVCIRVWSYLPLSSMFTTLLDLLTTSIPPTLPTAMSVGIGFAIQRLHSITIRCSNPQKILVGGEVETVCFEKTGTLTKKDMTVMGFALCENRDIKEVITKPEQIATSRYAATAFQLMATCHSVFKSISQGNLLGKPTDTAMFEFSTGKITQSLNFIELFGKKIQILKRFEFSFALQKMAVLVQTEDGDRKLFVKGDPQRVIRCCRQQTVPKDIGEYIGNQSQKGFKIVALSARSLTDSKQSTDSLKKLERQMLFLGVLIFSNPILQKSQQTVRTLLRSNVHTVVLSGDNELTSGAIAFGCGMLDKVDLLYCDLLVDSRGKKKIAVRSRDSLSENREGISDMGVYLPETSFSNDQMSQVRGADEEWIKEFLFGLDEQQKQVAYGMTGRLFEELFMKRNVKSLQPIFSKTILFSRLLPKHRVGLFQYYQNINQVCAFVGENSREASGFRHADLSLALTQGQSSSFSHFSTPRGNLSGIVDLLRVCRAGLSTNFQTFKMMCQFSLMQFTTMIILYLNYEDLTSSEFLYVDLFVMCPIFITLSLTQPCDTLSKFKPPSSLFSKFNLLSMLGLFVLQLCGQIFIVETLKHETFYTDRQDHKRSLLSSTSSYNEGLQLSSTLFIFTNFLYMGVVIATSISKPFRKDFYTNPYLVANVLLLTVYNFAIPFVPQLVPDSMQIDQTNTDWYVFVVFWANILCLVMYVFERVLVWMMERVRRD